MFNILAGGEGQCIDSEKMHKLLIHLKPSEDEDALKQSADSMVNVMGTHSAGEISEEDFSRWLFREIGEEMLESLLNFTFEDRSRQLEGTPAAPPQSSTS